MTGLCDNRYYFKPGFELRTVPPGKTPYIDANNNVVPGGAMGIRIHLGNNGQGSGSEGCQVSPYYRELRMALIGYHEQANATYYAENQDSPWRDHLHDMATLQEEPDWLASYRKLGKQVDALTNQIQQLVSDPLNVALGDVLRAGNADQVLRAVGNAIAQAQLDNGVAKETPDEMADVPSDDQVIADLRALLDLLSEDDAAAVLQWVRDNAEVLSRLQQQITQLEQEKADFGPEVGMG